MSFSEFSRIARTLYVDVARKEFGKNGRPANKSRIAVLTGLSRTRVRQELETTESDASPDDNTAKVRPASRVLMGWHTDADFTSKAGRARELTGEEFGDLYERYSGKVVPVTAMLKELLSVGAVKMTATGKLRVLARSFTPQQTDSDALARVSMAIRDLAETASHNLYSEPDQDRRFERFATNQLVPAAHFDEFQQFVAHEGQLFLEKIDDWMAAREDDASKDAVRIGVGVYQIAPRENS
ncbi:MAG: hypothetical protein HKN49_04530 [Gammaproteobacteria bacterium]|nr:hypothetical protein [Gammaproteobacteria bacterium]